MAELFELHTKLTTNVGNRLGSTVIVLDDQCPPYEKLREKDYPETFHEWSETDARKLWYTPERTAQLYTMVVEHISRNYGDLASMKSALFRGIVSPNEGRKEFSGDGLQSETQREQMLAGLAAFGAHFMPEQVHSVYDKLEQSKFGDIKLGENVEDLSRRSSKEMRLAGLGDATAWFNVEAVRKVFPTIPADRLVVRPNKLLLYKNNDHFDDHVDTPIPSHPEGWPRVGTISVLLHNTVVDATTGRVLESSDSNDAIDLSVTSDEFCCVQVRPSALVVTGSEYFGLPETVVFAGSLPHCVEGVQISALREDFSSLSITPESDTLAACGLPRLAVYRLSVTFDVYHVPLAEAAGAAAGGPDHCDTKCGEEHALKDAYLRFSEALYGMKGQRRFGVMLQGKYTFDQVASRLFTAPDAEVINGLGAATIVVPVRIYASYSAYDGEDDCSPENLDDASTCIEALLPESVRRVLVDCGFAESALANQYKDIPGTTRDDLRHLLDSPLFVVVGRDAVHDDILQWDKEYTNYVYYTGNECQPEESARTYQTCIAVPRLFLDPLPTDEVDRAAMKSPKSRSKLH